jgi:hypothetical protein
LLEPTKLLPPSGEVERPEVELADPVLALSMEDEEEVADDTPEEENVCGYASRPCSELSQKARAPLRLSMEGVGDVMAPDFCLTIVGNCRTGHTCHVANIKSIP